MLVIGEFHWDLSELVTIQIPEGGRERDLEREGEREKEGCENRGSERGREKGRVFNTPDIPRLQFHDIAITG